MVLFSSCIELSETFAMTPSQSDVPQDLPQYLPATGSFLVPHVLPHGHAQLAASRPLSRPPQLAAFPSAAELLQAFRHRWLLAIFVGLLLGGALGAATWILKPPKFTASSLIRVASIEPHLLPAEQAAMFRGDSDAFQRTQMALVKTRRVLSTALMDKDVATLNLVLSQPEPVVWLEEELKVNYLEGTELLRIALSGDNPNEVASIVNAVKTAYLKEVADKEHNFRADRHKELNNVILQAEEALRTKREHLLKLNPKANVADPKQVHEGQAIEVQQLQQLLNQSALLKRDMDLFMSLKAAEEAKLTTDHAPKVPEHMIEKQLDVEPSVAELHKSVVKIEMEVEEQRRSLKGGIPQDSALRRLNSAKEQLKVHRDSLRPTVKKRLEDDIRSKAEEQSEEYKRRLEFLLGQQTELQGNIVKAKEAVENLGKNKMGAQELILRAEIEQQENIIRIARTEKERLFVEMQSQSRRIREEEPVQVPKIRNWRPQLLSAGLVGGWGLLLGLVGVSYREYRTRRISSKEEVAQHLNLPVFGTLPVLASANRRGMLPFVGRRRYDWNSVLRESVDSIAATLMRNERTEARRMLMVSSPRSGEGKTTLSVHLASSIARSRRKTLLVDADLHHPSVHRLFDLPGQPGLGEVLRGEVEANDAVQAGPIEGLYILPAGSGSGEATQLLANPNAVEFFNRLRQEFDYIIIDSSPVLPVVDALLVGAQTDGVILSVRPRVSQLPQVHDACERLHSARIPVLGAVLNGVEVKAYTYDYPYHGVGAD
jgi:capsular exopolysaccharide synthesis family protein